MSTVQRWLSTLGDTAIEGYPPLAVLAAWVAVLTGQTAEAQRWAAIVDASSFDLVPADGSASFDSTRAMLRSAMCVAGPDQAIADARLAVRHEQPWSPWRDQALYLLGEAHLLTGDVDQAGRPVHRGVRPGRHERQHRCARAQRIRADAVGHGSGPMDGRHRAPRGRARHHRSASGARLRLECARLRRCRPAGRAPRRPERGQSSAHLGDASPTDLGHPAAVPRRAGSIADGQAYWALGDQATARHLSARDRRHLACDRPHARRPRRRRLGLPNDHHHRREARAWPAVCP